MTFPPPGFGHDGDASLDPRANDPASYGGTNPPMYDGGASSDPFTSHPSYGSSPAYGSLSPSGRDRPLYAPTPAGAGVRLGASLLDGIIVFAVIFVLMAIWLFVFASPEQLNRLVAAVDEPSSGAAYTLVSWILFGYLLYVLMETRWGATPGKAILRLRVIGAGGGRPTFGEAARRNLWRAVSLLEISGLPLFSAIASVAIMISLGVSIANDSYYSRGWHDRLGGTRVVRI